MDAPWQGRGEHLQPLPGRVSLFLFYPGGSLRSPPANFLSPRWGGIPTVSNHVPSAKPAAESVSTRLLPWLGRFALMSQAIINLVETVANRPRRYTMPGMSASKIQRGDSGPMLFEGKLRSNRAVYSFRVFTLTLVLVILGLAARAQEPE